MNHFKTFLFVFCIYSHQIASGAIDCVMDSDNWCIFEGISTSERYPYFEPSYPNPLTVQTIFIGYSTMPILTTEICAKFSNLKTLVVQKCSLDQIKDGALSSCTELERFEIKSNGITKLLNLNLFANNQNLTFIDLSYNKLMHIDVKMFENTKKLFHLDLSNNLILQFGSVGMPKLENLWKLNLNNNNLLILNETVLVDKFPNLKHIGLGGNLFDCQKLESMLTMFDARNTNLMNGCYQRIRHASFKIKQIYGTDCLDREALAKLVAAEIMNVSKIKLSQLLSSRWEY